VMFNCRSKTYTPVQLLDIIANTQKYSFPK